MGTVHARVRGPAGCVTSGRAPRGHALAAALGERSPGEGALRVARPAAAVERAVLSACSAPRPPWNGPGSPLAAPRGLVREAAAMPPVGPADLGAGGRCAEGRGA